MATENVFSSPWNDSDLVLIVEEKELHVHKLFLTSQSPVFKAMMQEGHFQEASQGKITLEGKQYNSMVQFLKILYPQCMFQGAKVSINDENLLPILKLADEYQCVNVIKQCIDDAKITGKNVLQLLPYAMQYHQPAMRKIIDVLKWGASTAKLQQLLPKLDSKDSIKMQQMILTKCSFLESTIVKMQDALTSLICDFLIQEKTKYDDKLSMPLSKKTYSQRYSPYSSLKAHDLQIQACNHKCGHTISVKDISMAKSCVHCRNVYKKEFILPIPSCAEASHSFIKMLHKGHDIVTAVKEI